MEIIQALKFKNTGFASPTIYEFEDKEGNKYIFRYRHGKYKLKYKTTNMKDYILKCEGDYGSEYDGFLATEDFLKLLFVNHKIGIIIRSTFNQETNVEAQITLYERMKSYESFDKLDVNDPVIIRLDGVAFHTFTKGLDKPFDNALTNLFMLTCDKLFKNIQNIKFIYSQSDEINLVLTCYEKESTQSWFDYRVQKLCSVISSMTTSYFNKYISDILQIYTNVNNDQMVAKWRNKQYKAVFDCRCFNIPKYEVSNYFIYRQLDALRNSKLSLGQKYFSQKELNNKSTNDIEQMLHNIMHVDWSTTPIVFQRGFCLYKKGSQIVTDIQIPLFTDDRNYILKHISN